MRIITTVTRPDGTEVRHDDLIGSICHPGSDESWQLDLVDEDATVVEVYAADDWVAVRVERLE